MVHIQYTSDLHINDWPVGTPFESFVTPTAPILVLAGDVCSAWDPLYEQFLTWVSRHWRITILITGNHEYYCDEPVPPHTMEETDAHIRALASRLGNVVFLQAGESYVLPGTAIRFVGATLWSAIEPTIWDEIMAQKGDYKATYTGTMFSLRRTHPSDITALHAYHKAYLRSAIAAPVYVNEKLIVVTHHLPTHHLLEDEYKQDVWRSCYASHDDDLFAPNVHTWICGHGHRATEFRIPGGPRLLMNARGYNRKHEQERTVDVYDPKGVFLV